MNCPKLSNGAIALVCLVAVLAGRLSAAEALVYIGTYTGARSQGIYVAHFDDRTGTLSKPELAAETKNPTFLAAHPKESVLYAVGEVDDFGGKRVGSVSAFRIQEKSGKLSLLNRQPSGGTGPCHLAVDQTGHCLLVANYGSGSIAALPIQSDRHLEAPSSVIQHHGKSADPLRQEGPHAHHITVDPANRFVLTCDLGLDQVLVYRLDPHKGVLEPSTGPFASLKAGAGPRHLVFHPNGRTVYVINEMGSSITAFDYDAGGGKLAEVQTLSTLPEDFKAENTCAEVQVHPSGKFVYGSNRGHNSIAIFEVNSGTGKLRAVGHQATGGKTPRHFGLDPSGKWLLAENQDSDSIVVFALDSGGSTLRDIGRRIEVGAPVCIAFVPITSF